MKASVSWLICMYVPTPWIPILVPYLLFLVICRSAAGDKRRLLVVLLDSC
jgi:hypothetical protein